jgi:hypothetical protein
LLKNAVILEHSRGDDMTIEQTVEITEYSIKACFDGEKITPNDDKPKESILDFAGMFDKEDVEIIEEIIRERYEPSWKSDYAVS